MSFFADLRERMSALLFPGRKERELEEEMRFHLEREAEERMHEGADRATARQAAARAFGGVERYKEEVRDARGTALLEQVVSDLRYAARTLRHNPGFAASVVAVLGLAIGAAGAVFSVTDAVLLSELPYPQSSRLVRIFHENSSTNRWGLSVADVMAIREQQRSFSAFGAVGFSRGALAGAGAPQSILIGRATAGFFEALRATVVSGRPLGTPDESPSAPAVAVVADEVARRGLGGPEAAVGRSIMLDGASHTVVGVLPPGVRDLAGIPAGVWAPMILQTPTRRGPFGIRGFARLKDGITLEAAAADLAAIAERIFPLWSAGFRDRTARYAAQPLRESIVGTSGRQIGLFAGAVVLVLLVAIANVATLLLVRATARETELSLRTALGAERRRLAGLVASEGVLLTLLSAAAGLGIALAALRLVTAVAPRLPRIGEVSLGSRGIVVIGALALIAGLLVNLSPVAAALRGRSAGSLRSDARRSGTSRRTSILRGALVISEFALALPLLLAAGLLLNSFLRLSRINPGFDPEGVVAIQVTPPTARYAGFPELQRFWRQLITRAGEQPMFTAVGASGGLPPDLFGQTNNFNLVSRPVAEGAAEYVSVWATVSPGYFAALGIPLMEGRLFNEGDSASAAAVAAGPGSAAAAAGPPAVVIVSRAWAARYFPGESAVGQQLISGGCYQCPRTTVVGVAGDVKYSGIAGDAEAVYQPLAQSQARGMFLVVRSRVAPAAALATLREQVATLDPGLPVTETSLAEQLRNSLADPRRWTGILGAFAGVGLLLAALGIFGLMSYTVRQRRREIGVRLALGAEPGAITRMIVARGMSYAGLGTAAGLLIAMLEQRWLGSLLYDVGATDPLTLGAAALVLLLSALGASWLPGWRAARIRPIEVMQAE